MSAHWLDSISETLRDKVQTAVSSAFDFASITAIQPVPGGASGALTYKLEAANRAYLLRIETRRSPLRNPHQYPCMRIAAEAGIAPRLHYENDADGVVIIDFIRQQPIADYPGGPITLASALGKLAANLQQQSPFPVLADYRVVIQRLLQHIKTGFAPDLLAPHIEAFERIRAAYPWTPDSHISSHNDLNRGNVLFDGQRLWLIDWETAYRNDPLTDIAVLSQNYATTPELETALLTAWQGAPPDQHLRARLLLMTQLTRLYYAGLLLAMSANPSNPIADLSVPTAEEFRAQIAAGQGKPPGPEIKTLLGKMNLAVFLHHVQTPEFEQALSTVKTG